MTPQEKQWHKIDKLMRVAVFCTFTGGVFWFIAVVLKVLLIAGVLHD